MNRPRPARTDEDVEAPTLNDDLEAMDDDAPPSSSQLDPLLPPTLAQTLGARGFKSLTAVQTAVLDPELQGRDLRISSQTGSGKTVAVGFVLYPIFTSEERSDANADDVRPTRALVLAPTRELAAQVASELSWLYQADGLRVIAVTGGTSVGGELRSLRKGADVVVGTPGRMLDHLERGAIDPRGLRAVVLDEADQMLDFGFRDELEGILKRLPTDRRTHMLSATFPRDVLDLAGKFQRDAVAVQGTRLGDAHSDIAHVAMLTLPGERGDAIVNLLLRAGDAPTLVFVRTRNDAAELSAMLTDAGFPAAPLTGEIEQRDRTRTLDAFRRGAVRVLVATDVAARGLDVPDVSLVIHGDPPMDAETYTHRSGRTGRAGRKGTSIVLVAPAARDRIGMQLRRVRVTPTWAALPSPDDVRAAEDARLLESIATTEPTQDARLDALANALLESMTPHEVVTRLLARGGTLGPCEPRRLTILDPTADTRSRDRRARPEPFPRRGSMEPRRYEEPRSRDEAPPQRSMERAPFVRPTERLGVFPGARAPERAPERAAERPTERSFDRGPERSFERAPERSFDRPPRAPGPRPNAAGFVTFHVNWGAQRGADARRLLALVCRRGGVRGGEVGAIDVGPSTSRVEIATDRADEFFEAAKRPDAREPWLQFERLGDRAAPTNGNERPHNAEPPRRRYIQPSSNGGPPMGGPPRDEAPRPRRPTGDVPPRRRPR